MLNAGVGINDYRPVTLDELIVNNRKFKDMKKDLDWRSNMSKKKDEITIRSSAAEYLTYIASVGDQQDSIEMRYEDENIKLASS